MPFSQYKQMKKDEFYPEHHGEEDKFRTIFHHDRAEVTYSPYFRRMAFKKYHIKPGPDNRTRLLHSMEVATISSLLARSFGLNMELTEAIALGHDVANPPYNGEKILGELLEQHGDKYGFDHGELSANILEWGSLKEFVKDKPRFKALKKIPYYREIDDGGKKITTISQQVLDGIKKHTPPVNKKGRYEKYDNLPQTMEGQIVRIADNLSYISQEVDEAIKFFDRERNEYPFHHLLISYQNQRLFVNPEREDDQMSDIDLLKSPHLNIEQDPRFLKNIFDDKLGPRLMTMILRIVNYNIELYKNKHPEDEKFIELCDTEFCNEGKMPVLKYDTNLDYILDYYWDVFIREVNKRKEVERNKICNKEKIKAVFKYRLNNYGELLSFEKEDFKKREAEVNYYYPDLSNKNPRVVAHHIATLTDDQIDIIYNTLPKDYVSSN